jgi:Cu/Ag efflux pump CusA
MLKRMMIMLVAAGILFGGIFGYKLVKAKTMRSMAFQPPPVSVTAMTASLQPWQPQITAVGGLRAVRGVEVTSEIAGLVHAIRFQPGDEAAAGQVLVELTAAAIRLRPILMTTAAMVLGVLPLVTASGAGAAGRFNMGLVIMTGIAIGTLFTLYVVPAMYLLFAAEHGKEKATESRQEPVLAEVCPSNWETCVR